VSTGQLPPRKAVAALVAEAHARFRSSAAGRNSQVYPALADVPADLFGICVAGTDGSIHEAGDAEYEFTIMSVSKPFVFALVCELLGPDEARYRPPEWSRSQSRGSASATARWKDRRS
jgi:glutaminase